MKKGKKKKLDSNIRPKAGIFRYLGPILGLITMVFLAYYPSVGFDFVNWDDYHNLVENPRVLELSWDSVKAIFTEPVIANYNPMPVFTFAIEHHFFGMDPAVFHFNNIVLHIFCSIAAFWLVIKLGFNRNVAILVAFLFALHPMRVESVAWITERKDVLFALFFFLSAGFYIKYKEAESRKWLFYIVSLLFFAISLLSKIQAVSLPLALLAFDYLHKKRLSFDLIKDKIPYFLGALGVGVLGVYLLDAGDSLDADSTFSFVQRLFIGGYSYLVYLYKFFFPSPMSPLYPYNSELDWTIYAGAVISVCIVAFLLWKHKNNKMHVLLFGMLFFTLNVMFMLQIVGAGQGFLADRFTYVPYLGLFIAFAYYLEEYFVKVKSNSSLYYGVGAIVLLLCFIRTKQQLPIWENGATLWTKVVEYFPKSTTAYNNRGQWNRDRKRLDLALQDYTTSVGLNPNQYEVFIGRGKLYFDQGKNELAINDFNKGLSIEPDNQELLVNRGVSLAAKGDLNGALKDLSRAIDLHPEFINAYLNRSLVYYKLGQFQNAIKDYDAYLAVNPSKAEIWYEKGLALRNLKKEEEAIKNFDFAIQRNPTIALIYQEKAAALHSLGRTEEALMVEKLFNKYKK